MPLGGYVSRSMNLKFVGQHGKVRLVIDACLSGVKNLTLIA